MMEEIYFDYAATTPPLEEVLNNYVLLETKFFGNPQSDLNVSQLIEQSKSKILENLNLKNHEIIFTSGGTEANNLAILSKYNNFDIKKHFVCSAIEHPSVLESFKELEKKGHEVSYVLPHKDGVIYKEDVLKELRKDTVFVSVMSVNNELGTSNDINDIFKSVKEYNKSIITMSDCVQAIGKKEINLENVDLATFSAHKIYGLKGVGMLIKVKNIQMEQIIFGSKTSIRPGTMSVGAIVSFVKVFLEANNNYEQRVEKIKELQDYFLSLLDENITLNCNGIGIMSFTLNIKALSQTVVEYLYEKGIIISTKSSCAQKLNEPSHVLLALNMDREKIDRTIRISFSYKTKKSDVLYLSQKINEVLKIF